VPLTPESTLNIIVAAAVFCLLCALWLAGLFLWSLRKSGRESRIEARLGLREHDGQQGATKELRLWHDGVMSTTMVPDARIRVSMLERIRRLHRAAGIQMDLGAWLLSLGAVGSLAAAGIFLATQNILFALAVPAVLVLVTRGYLGFRVNARDRIFEKQFIEALELASRSLRAGHPLLAAFQLIAQEMPAPVRLVFLSICQQHAMGVRLEDAILRVAAESTSPDLKLFSTAVAIQIRTGGNLAVVIDRLANVIRDRVRLGRRVRVLTAQTQFSKRVLIALPILLFFVLNAANPEYMKLLYQTSVGQGMLVVGGAALTLGVIVMNRLAILKY
jgi:tight adherence protein B